MIRCLTIHTPIPIGHVGSAVTTRSGFRACKRTLLDKLVEVIAPVEMPVLMQGDSHGYQTHWFNDLRCCPG